MPRQRCRFVPRGRDEYSGLIRLRPALQRRLQNTCYVWNTNRSRGSILGSSHSFSGRRTCGSFLFPPARAEVLFRCCYTPAPLVRVDIDFRRRTLLNEGPQDRTSAPLGLPFEALHMVVKLEVFAVLLRITKVSKSLLELSVVECGVQ